MSLIPVAPLYLARSRSARPLPSRLYRPCRSPQSLHSLKLRRDQVFPDEIFGTRMNDETRNFIDMRTKSFERNGSDHGRLGEKVAIITGAGTGIGEAIAHKFAKEGARVVVSGLQDDPIEDVAESIRDKGGEAVAFGGDISEAGVAKECVDFAINKFKRLDVLINNA